MNLNCRFIIMNKKYIFYNSIIVAVLFSFCIYSQDCDGGYTYIENLPEENFSNIINENNCFNDNNIAVLNELILLNAGTLISDFIPKTCFADILRSGT